VDAEFPADNTALFLDPDGPAQGAYWKHFVEARWPDDINVLWGGGPVTSEVRSWRRPREINPKSALFVGGSCDSDVVQGALGDCWFLAALCGTSHLCSFGWLAGTVL
jgi:hypothetical protein